MSFFDKFSEAFENRENDPEVIRMKEEKKKTNEEIAAALAAIQEEAKFKGQDFFYNSPANGTDETWTTHYKGVMFAIFNTEVRNRNKEKQINTIDSVKELLMEKIKL